MITRVLDKPASEQARDIGMENSERNAETAYKEAVVAIIRTLCGRQEYITSDDVAEGMRDIFPLLTTHDKRVVGPMFRRAQRLGYCKPTMQFISTKQPKQHASPMRVWQSCIFSQPK